MKIQFKNTMKIMTGVVVAALIFLTSGCNASVEQRNTTSENANGDTQVKAPDVDLHMAVITNNLEAIRGHIKAGSDLNVKDPFGGSTPLITASLFGNVEAATLLIDAGAEINARNNEGSTALHTAAFFCYPDLIKLLLDKGIDKSIKNNYGVTARESVQAPYSDLEPVYKMMSKQFAPMGLKMDFERIEKTRPLIAEQLK